MSFALNGKYKLILSAIVFVVAASSLVFFLKFSGKAQASDADLSDGTISPSQQELISSIPGLITSQQTLIDQVSSLRESSTGLSDLSNSISVDLDSLNRKTQTNLEASQASANERFALLQSELDSYKSELLALKDAMLKIEEDRKKETRKKLLAAKHKQPVMPNFIVQSIMYWDAAPTVVVLFNDATVSLSPKDTLDGWMVNSIDASCANFIKKSVSQKLCI